MQFLFPLSLLLSACGDRLTEDKLAICEESLRSTTKKLDEYRDAERQERKSHEALSALAKLLGDDLSPDQARLLEAQIVAVLGIQAPDISRTLGRDILDENGRITDPIQVTRDLNSSMIRRGLKTDARRLAWRSMLGNEPGSRVFNAMQPQ